MMLSALCASADTLSREEVAALAEPSVVRVVQHVTGKATIPVLKVDLKSLSVEADSTQPAHEVSIDDYLSGTGFIVAPDGYILTNSHVASEQSVKLRVISETVFPEIVESSFSLSEEESKKLFEDSDASFEFSKKVFEYTSSHSTFDIKSQLVVLNPASQKRQIDDLLSEGFPATIVMQNERFYADDKDVALIHIDRDNLPALSLGSSSNIKTGNNVYIFGFPATAEFNQRNPLEATFTQGVISAFKDSQEGDFKVIQTDAKVSEGSSGGPLLNDRGEVVGMVTFQSNALEQTPGDNFAFALPSDMVRSSLGDNIAALRTGVYQEHFLAGLRWFHERRCVKALDAFHAAQESIASEFSLERSVGPYISQCETWIELGTSSDTSWKRLQAGFASVNAFVWFLVGVLVISVLSLLLLVVKLFRRVQREEVEIDTLEHRLEDEEALLKHDHELIEKMSKKTKD